MNEWLADGYGGGEILWLQRVIVSMILAMKTSARRRDHCSMHLASVERSLLLHVENDDYSIPHHESFEYLIALTHCSFSPLPPPPYLADLRPDILLIFNGQPHDRESS